MFRNLAALLLSLAVCGTVQAQEEQTPRQAFDQVQGLFASGHAFTAEELSALSTLEQRLVDNGESDVAADLNLLRLAATARSEAQVATAQAQATLSDDALTWETRQRLDATRGFWRTTRDVGLWTFTLSSVTTLLLAQTLDNDENLLRNGYFSDWSDRNKVVNGMRWAFFGSAATTFLSLFPLLWGEARQ